MMEPKTTEPITPPVSAGYFIPWYIREEERIGRWIRAENRLWEKDRERRKKT